MLKQTNQMTFNFSKYSELYDILIPQNNKWRRMNEEVDFSFIYEYLKDSYSMVWEEQQKMLYLCLSCCY